MDDCPLANVRVLDLSRLLPGPYCSRILTGTTVRSGPPGQHAYGGSASASMTSKPSSPGI